MRYSYFSGTKLTIIGKNTLFAGFLKDKFVKYSLTTNRHKIYWLSQIGGWVLYIIANLVIIGAYQKLDGRIALELTYLGVLGVGVTHVYRFWLKKHQWLKLQVKEIAPRVVGASVLSAVLITLGLFAVLYFSRQLHLPGTRLSFFFLNNIFEITLILLIWSLLYFAFHYMENYRNSEIEKLVWEAAVKDFELKTLKSQLNPHFMFNALNSIRALIEENPERAKKAITQLSNIFRYSLRIERIETISLDEELRTVEDYLALEKVRYEERLSYGITYSQEAGRVEIPPMMIQTLVENGIKHGVSKLPKGGVVSVNAKVFEDKLYITIVNSGTVDDEEVMNTKGFGLSNTKHRLHLLYGSKGSFTLVNGHGEVKAEIIIPIGDRTS